ncbi:MAG: hypothetical protein GC150_11685 [Rhizobiales bacterium]|nr:hypothetical protein [Hyphomicrobiales bacterium]
MSGTSSKTKLPVPTTKGRALVTLTGVPASRPASGLHPVQLRRTARHSLIWAAALLGTMLFALACAGALLHMRLVEGPMQFASLVMPIERAINAELDGIALDIGDAVVQYGEKGRGIQFRLRDLTVRDGNGVTVGRAPFASVDISLAALLAGRLAPERISFIRPRLLLVYDDEEGLAIGFGQEGSSVRPADGSANEGGAPVAGSDGVPLAEDAGAPSRVEIAPQDTSSRIGLAAAFAKVLAGARRREGVGSYLTQFAVEDAVVMVDHGQGELYLTVPEYTVDLAHRQRRSEILGAGSILSPQGPWRLGFLIDESEKFRRLRLRVQVDGFVPSMLGELYGALGLLNSLETPIAGEIRTVLTTEGEVRDAAFDLELAAGRVLVGSLFDDAINIRGGSVRLRYVRDGNRWDLLDSTIRGEASEATLSGYFLPAASVSGQNEQWNFELSGRDGRIQGPDGIGAEPIERLTARGTIDIGQAAVGFEQVRVGFTRGEVAMRGRVTGDDGVQIAIRGTDLGVDTIKRLWPRAMAPHTRSWLLASVERATVRQADVALSLRPDEIRQLASGQGVREEAVNLQAVIDNAAIGFAEGVAPAELESVDLRVSGKRVHAIADIGRLPLAGTSDAIELSRIEATVGNYNADDATALISFHAEGQAGTFGRYASQRGIKAVDDQLGLVTRLDGKGEAKLSLVVPLAASARWSDVRPQGRLRLSEVTIGEVIAGVRITSGEIGIDLGASATELKGDVLLNGIPARVHWLNLHGDERRERPALRIMAELDAADREQLGIPINHLVRGRVPVEVSLRAGPGRHPEIELQADFTQAMLLIEGLSWRKPPGQRAVLEARLVPALDGGIELQNLKIAGDPLGIEGWASIGPDNQLKAFRFPDFQLNILTQLEIDGERGVDDIWRIRARGRTYDGRAFFRSLFAAEQLGQRTIPKAQAGLGVDIEAEIDTVVGYSQVNIYNLRLRAQKRADVLVSFEALGNLEKGAEIGVRLTRNENGKREFIAQTNDAGSAYRLVGFYDGIIGGSASLKVNLDDEGETRTGTLWTQDFALLGDPVERDISTDYSATASRDRSGGSGRTRTERLKIGFDQLYVPFSVGQGRFIMQDAYVNGPALGATMRGFVDFNNESVHLGGTYVPAYGINAAFRNFPIIGGLLTGRPGEGLIGLAFAINGRLENPQVVVNPITMAIPGIFRQIFEFQPPPPPPIAAVGAPRTARRATGSGDGDESSASQVFGEDGVSTVGVDDVPRGTVVEGPALPQPQPVPAGSAVVGQGWILDDSNTIAPNIPRARPTSRGLGTWVGQSDR